MFGKDDEREEARKERKKNREYQLHGSNLGGNVGDDQNKAEILSQLSEISDLPIGEEDPVMGQLVSQLASTANLSEEDVRSKEWVFEYLRLINEAQYPPSYGITGARRAWVYDDASQHKEALVPEDDATLESFTDNAKRALTRSEDAKVIEESTRSVSESVVRDESQDENGGSSGLLGRMGLR
ncbi:hypothetical protein C475_11700 [Halosimplex carlsbadense 2-9-1]|uniref:Uncharacterized protein n=1 Tax=Halosimplex carlsbadense 2-9-1 TaxID=797114 RepID=M0CSQ2_9EURY|nr:hypothetical protein [Halosimplex carlsbadense]ELZ24899.1 hypothetical protein C475_11700 [Halosimplex carlsbadense 2-9-1]